MRKTVDTILRKYGVDVTLSRKQGDVKVRCFFQPVNSTSWQSIAHTESPIGHSNRAEYLCIAPAEAGIREDDILTCGGRYYQAQRVEPYCCCAEPVYLWVLCLEKGGQDTWGA